MASNTQILIRRSGVGGSGKPSSLLDGELAYSYASNTMFIGSPTGDGVINVGGLFYASQVDNATDAATGSTLVKRDASGNASFNYVFANVVGTIDGNANSATQLQTARNFSISGGDITASAISFNGTGDVTLNASLDSVSGLGAGTYGSTTEIPVIQVAANGRVMNVTTASISTTLNTSADSGTGSINLATDTLNLIGAEGLTSSATGNSVTFTVDDTVVRSNTSAVGPQTINTTLTIGANNDLIVTGNLFVTGNVVSQNVQQLAVQDPLIVLGIGNYFSDTRDIGFAAHYNDGANAHTGLVRDADGDKEYYFFEGYTPDVDASNNIDITDPSFRKSNVHANYVKANLIANTVVSDGFYGKMGTNLMYLYPSETYAVSGDQYIIIDPTAPNHIHLRAGGAIDASTADLYLGGELTNVLVSDSGDAVTVTAAGNTSVFNSDGTLTVPTTIYTTNGDIESGRKVLAAQGAGTAGGFSFTGTEGGRDSGMFSNADGNVHFFADNTDIAYFTPSKFEISKQVNLTGINKGTSLNVVYYNASTGELTYDVDNSLTPTSIANGAYSLSIQSTDGLLVTNGAGLQLTNGAVIKDTAGDAVAFGSNAGAITQGSQAVAIGDSAGYNNQSAYAVAIGYGAGNVSQGQQAVAIGINAGISNQGIYGVAIGSSSGTNQGSGGVAIGYDTGGGQGQDSVAIGTQAAKGNTTSIGANSIAIGRKAGFESAAASSIILNASGDNLSSATSGFFVNPVRYTASQDATYDGIVFYNSDTKEVRYSYKLDGGSF